MKKYILIFSILMNSTSYSQSIDPNQIKNDLKEVLALHMLSLKNNSDELKEFLNRYEYIIDSDEDNLYFGKKNRDSPKPYIIMPFKNEEEVQSSLTIFYLYDNNIKIDYNLGTDVYNSMIKAILLEECPEGFKCYDGPMHTLVKTEEMFKREGTSYTWVDEYTLVENDLSESGKKMMNRASNFIAFGDIIGFSGPVDHAIILRFIFDENEDGSVTIKIFIHSEYSEINKKTDSFNYLQFMSFENLNDRIWR